jgi:hypothetical protein
MVLAGGAWLPGAELVNEGLAGGPREERTDNICVDDVSEGIALLRELVYVVPEGFARLLFAALEVLGISRAHICPLEVLNKDLFELAKLRMVLGSKNLSHARTYSPTQMGRY